MWDRGSHGGGCVVDLLLAHPPSQRMTNNIGKDGKGRDLELLVVLSLIMHLNLNRVDFQQLGTFLSLVLAVLANRGPV